MGLLSSSVSITRYQVEGQIQGSFHDIVSTGLNKNCITEIDNDISEKGVGWTSIEHPYSPDFHDSSYMFGTYLIFSLRIDKKSIPSKIVKKHCEMEEAKRMSDSGKEFFSKNEKKMIKEQVIQSLCLRTPATPNIYDIVWNYEDKKLWFFSNLNSANEELETLFKESFKLRLIRMFPYTEAENAVALTHSQKDVLNHLSLKTFSN